MGANTVGITPEELERLALGWFWSYSEHFYIRLKMLQTMAYDAIIPRYPTWTNKQARTAPKGLVMARDRCYACLRRDRTLYIHHIIQVQHGGSSTPRNMVAICHECHRKIHPWLDEREYRVRRSELIPLGDCVPDSVEEFLESLR